MNTPTHLQPPAQKMVLNVCKVNVSSGMYGNWVAERDVTHLVQLVEQLQGELEKALEAALTAANSNKFPVELNKT